MSLHIFIERVGQLWSPTHLSSKLTLSGWCMSTVTVGGVHVYVQVPRFAENFIHEVTVCVVFNLSLFCSYQIMATVLERNQDEGMIYLFLKINYIRNIIHACGVMYKFKDLFFNLNCRRLLSYRQSQFFQKMQKKAVSLVVFINVCCLRPRSFMNQFFLFDKVCFPFP